MIFPATEILYYFYIVQQNSYFIWKLIETLRSCCCLCLRENLLLRV